MIDSEIAVLVDSNNIRFASKASCRFTILRDFDDSVRVFEKAHHPKLLAEDDRSECAKKRGVCNEIHVP